MKSMMKDPCMKQISRGLIDFGPVTAFCRAYAGSTMNTILHIFMPKGWILQDPKHELSDVEYCNKRYHMYQFIVRTHEYSFNYSIEKELLKCEIKAKACSYTRWMLTRSQASVAEMYALGAISMDDVEWSLCCDICDIPQTFHEYVKEFGREYDEWLSNQIINNAI